MRLPSHETRFDLTDSLDRTPVTVTKPAGLFLREVPGQARVHVHQQIAAFVDQYPDVGMLALEKPALLNDPVQARAVDQARMLAQRDTGAARGRLQTGPMPLLTEVNEIIAEPQPRRVTQLDPGATRG